jgi:hypothetical protein
MYFSFSQIAFLTMLFGGLNYTKAFRYVIIQHNLNILFYSRYFFYESGAGRSQFINLS